MPKNRNAERPVKAAQHDRRAAKQSVENAVSRPVRADKLDGKR